MNKDSIIFDSKKGFVYAAFSFRRWYWGVVLSISLLLMNVAGAIGGTLYDFGSWLFNVTYQKWSLRNPLRAPLWRLGLWVEINAWKLGWMGDLGYRLFLIAYPRSGEESLDALNEVILNQHVSPSMRVVADNWNDVFSFSLPHRERNN